MFISNKWAFIFSRKNWMSTLLRSLKVGRSFCKSIFCSNTSIWRKWKLFQKIFWYICKGSGYIIFQNLSWDIRAVYPYDITSFQNYCQQFLPKINGRQFLWHDPISNDCSFWFYFVLSPTKKQISTLLDHTFHSISNTKWTHCIQSDIHALPEIGLERNKKWYRHCIL